MRDELGDYITLPPCHPVMKKESFMVLVGSENALNALAIVITASSSSLIYGNYPACS